MDSFLDLLATNWQFAIMMFCGLVLLVFFYHDTRPWGSFKGIVRTLFLAAGAVLGLVIGVAVVMPILLVLFYWAPGRADVLVLATTMVAGETALAFVGKIFKIPGVEMFRLFSRFLLLVAASCAIGIVAVTVTSLMVATYPNEVTQSIGRAWVGFRDLAAACLFFSMLTAAVIHMIAERLLADLIPTVPTLPPLTRKRANPTVSTLARRAIGKRNVQVFLKALGLILLVSFIIVPVDQRFVLFVPRVSTGEERPYSSHGCPVPGHLTVVRLLNGTDRFYQVMQLNYVVTMPIVRHLVDQLYFPNPSNFSRVFQDPMTSLSDVGMLWAKGSSGVSVVPQGYPGTVTGIVANLTMASDPIANVTVFYSQEFLKRDVTVEPMPLRIDNANHSYVYSFIFKNNEDLCVLVSRIELRELITGQANSTGVRALVDGNEFPGVFASPDGVNLNGAFVYSERTMNVTLVLPMKET